MMKKYFDVRCPYCFEQLRYNDAVFRCKSGDEQEDKYLKNSRLTWRIRRHKIYFTIL